MGLLSLVNEVVHLLEESEFAELRTNRNRYKITPDEQATLARKRIGVVGLSVGQSAALILALERSFSEMRLADSIRSTFRIPIDCEPAFTI